MGCPGATIVFEELVQLGCKKLIRVGTCGGLQPHHALGDLIVALTAVPADSTAMHLVGNEPHCPTASWCLIHERRARREGARPGAARRPDRLERPLLQPGRGPVRALVEARRARGRDGGGGALHGRARSAASRPAACSPSATSSSRASSRGSRDDELRAAVDRMTRIALDVAIADISGATSSSSSTRRPRTARPGKRWPELAHRAAELGLDGRDAPLGAARPPDRARARAAADGGRAARRRRRRRDAQRGRERRRRDATPSSPTIPLGTGQDFGRTYGIPTRLRRRRRASRSTGDARTIDARPRHATAPGGGEAERWFANVGSVGMSGAVAQRANGMSKALGGRATFFYALDARVRRVAEHRGDRDARRRRAPRADARRDRRERPLARRRDEARARTPQPDDGLFDVVLIGDVTQARLRHDRAEDLQRAGTCSHPKVEVLRSRTVAVDAAVPLPIEVEGEPVGTTPARFEVVPGAARPRAGNVP